MRTKKELDEFIHDIIGNDNLQYLSEEETVSAIIGYDSDSDALIYDYDKLVDAFVEHFGKYNDDSTSPKSYEELVEAAVDWVEFNTIRSLPYKDADYIVYSLETNEVIARFPFYEPKAEEMANRVALQKKGYVEYVEYIKPIIMHPINDYEDYCAPKPYEFNVEEQTEKCIQWIRDWFEENGKGCTAVLGMSGGKDSTIAAALCVKALGPDRVIGVAMPEKGQGINEADEICKHLGVKYIYAPITSMVEAFKGLSIVDENETKNGMWSEQTVQNVPPRVRMTMLYAIAQTYNGRPANTCNLSEDYVGYATLFGDSAGSFSPLGKFTVSEILAIGDYLGLPQKWVHKTPDDGLPHSCPDEEKFGFSYAELDNYIRRGLIPEGFVSIPTNNADVKATSSLKKIDKIIDMHNKNVFKVQIIQIPSYNPELPVY